MVVVFLNFRIKFNCPGLLHFGKKDKGIPLLYRKSKKYIKKIKIRVELFEYENADHGFNCNERKS